MPDTFFHPGVTAILGGLVGCFVGLVLNQSVRAPGPTVEELLTIRLTVPGRWLCALGFHRRDTGLRCDRPDCHTHPTTPGRPVLDAVATVAALVRVILLTPPGLILLAWRHRPRRHRPDRRTSPGAAA